MLYENTVAPETMGLLRELMQMNELGDFALVGGTNLSLRLGHRISEDIDLFTNQPYDSDALTHTLQQRYANDMLVVEKKAFTVLAYIKNIKVDLVLHRYPYLQPIEVIDGIRFAAVPDIVAMKLNAITRRGAKKDFFDLADLLDHYTLEEMLQFFMDKYANTDIGFVVRSLTYFTEADASKDPISLSLMHWGQVKEKIVGAVHAYWNT